MLRARDTNYFAPAKQLQPEIGINHKAFNAVNHRGCFVAGSLSTSLTLRSPARGTMLKLLPNWQLP